ncbi:MAG: hypothetical protein SFW67_08550 [Myxococcaceae bacterium]|nr:hypothetical protein [Myxococcaceae bacterium]
MTAQVYRRHTLALFLALWPALSPAQSSELAQRYLLGASRLYENLEYERALEQLTRARQASGGIDDDVTIALYEGVLQFELGREDVAKAAWREGLYLKPDAPLPVKVSPKIAKAFEALRVAVKAEVAPILARRAAEAARREAEARRQAEALTQAKVQLEQAQRAAEEARQRADADRRAQAEAEAKRAQAVLAQLEREVAARKAAEAEAADARDAKERLEQRLKRDRPEATPLEPSTPDTPPAVTAVARPLPVGSFVFAGLGLVAGGIATWFGLESTRNVALARAALLQTETVRALERARGDALIANIAIGVASAAAVGALIGLFLGRDAPAPAPAEAP